MRRALGCALGWWLCACSGVEGGDGSSDVGAGPGNPEMAVPESGPVFGSPEPFASPAQEADTDVPLPSEPPSPGPQDIAEPPSDAEVTEPAEVDAVPSVNTGALGAGASSGAGADEQGTQTGDQGSGGGAIGAGGSGGAASGGAGPCDPDTELSLPEETRWLGRLLLPNETDARPTASTDDAEVTVHLIHAATPLGCNSDVSATLTYSSEELSFSTTFVVTLEPAFASGDLSVAREQLEPGTLLPELTLFAPVESEPTMPVGFGGGGSPSQGSGGSAAGAGVGLGGQNGVAGAGASAPTPGGEQESSMCRLDPIIPDSSAPLGLSLAGSLLLDLSADSMQVSLSWVRREDGEVRWYSLPYGCAELGLATE